MAIWKGKVIVMAKKNNNIVLTINVKRAELAKAIDASTKTSKEVASILNDIMVNETYKDIEGCDSFKAWFDMNNDNIEGIGYKQAKSLVDCFNHVWKHEELKDIPCGTASALVSACKKDASKVIALAKAGKITRNTPQKVVRELLAKEGLRKGDVTTTKAKADDIVSDIAIVEKALKVILSSLEKKGKADEKERIAKAWDNIKVALDK